MLLEQHWKPPEVSSSLNGVTAEKVVVILVRVTGGNFRLIYRLLAQVVRIREINAQSMGKSCCSLTTDSSYLHSELAQHID